jgi:hypothetical protein
MNKKVIEMAMRARAFELRQMTGRGWSREELMKDKIWSDLNDKLTKKT